VALFTHTYSYDDASRLDEVTDGTVSATYSYLAKSPLIGSITYENGATTRMTATRTYDHLQRLTQITSVPSADSALGYSYRYNDANQRVRTTENDGSYWVYQYDTLGQVTSGRKYWANGTPVAGQQFDYAFDDIGNRTSSKAGGDETGQNLRETTYSANDLNQYTSRVVPGYADVLGSANAGATVSVNGDSSSTYRFGEYYRYELSLNNDPGAVYQGITNLATLDSVSQTNEGHYYLSPSTNSFSYDSDGNLTNDGLWSYTWSGENRLAELETVSGAPFTNKLVFIYDGQGRRVSKEVSSWNGSSWVADYQQKYVYDGWNLIGEFDTANVIVSSYMWGTDLSGSSQGAGGVGGLLALDNTAEGTHFVSYDGNGNVVALVDASDGTISARYEYDPFGKTIRSTGDLAEENTFRFSTKYFDDETSLSYYGYRYYNPSTGRWLNRDPIGENGGNNLLAFVRNDGVNRLDILGLLWATCKNECSTDGDVRVIDVQVVYLPAHLTPDKYKKINNLINHLGEVDFASNLIPGKSVASSIKNAVEVVVDAQLDSPTQIVNDALKHFSQSNLSWLRLWTRIEFQRCNEERCLWKPWCKVKRWGTHYDSPSDWKEYTVGQLPGFGYSGINDAHQHTKAATVKHTQEIYDKYD